MTITHCKRKGEYAESLFLARALALGYNVCKPWGDTAPFDFLLEKPGRRPLRIQVKSCWRRSGNHYNFRTTNNTPAHLTYTALDIDFIAALVVPIGVWYIVPIAAIAHSQSFFYVFPHGGERVVVIHPGPVRDGRLRASRPAAPQPPSAAPPPRRRFPKGPQRTTPDFEPYREAWRLLDAGRQPGCPVRRDAE